MNAELLQIFGDDNMVVDAARVSFGKEAANYSEENNARLIKYLASTVEYTETLRHVPVIQGKSSLGRLGLFVHVTAGFGDVGFKGHWTLELVCVQPIRIYAGMKIAQLVYNDISEMPKISYDKKMDAKYSNQGIDPQPSRYHKNKFI